MGFEPTCNQLPFQQDISLRGYISICCDDRNRTYFECYSHGISVVPKPSSPVTIINRWKRVLSSPYYMNLIVQNHLIPMNLTITTQGHFDILLVVSPRFELGIHKYQSCVITVSPRDKIGELFSPFSFSIVFPSSVHSSLVAENLFSSVLEATSVSRVHVAPFVPIDWV